MRILMIGDVIGKPGREAVRRILPDLRTEKSIDLVIANGENAAGGFGLTMDTASELLDSGVDVLTSGNHIWDKKEFIPYLMTWREKVFRSFAPPIIPALPAWVSLSEREWPWST